MTAGLIRGAFAYAVAALLLPLGALLLLRPEWLMFDGVPESVDLAAVHDYLLSLPGVENVHDLHVWAMGTSETALTAHFTMPGGHPGDAYFEDVAEVLNHRFGIKHPTIQVEFGHGDHGCAQPVRR